MQKLNLMGISHGYRKLMHLIFVDLVLKTIQ